jgi:phosphate starvation-inducible PhoH-like protein
MHEATISLADPSAVLSLFGPRDQHVRRIRERFNVSITHRDGEIRVAGDEAGVVQATQALEQLKDQVLRRGALVDDDVSGAVGRAAGDEPVKIAPIDVINVARSVKPRTAGQAVYVQAIRDNDLVFAIGPAGTGKTYLAVALAVEALKHKLIRKIVLVRPAVEAGESLGYLPGDLQAKINPYLRPLLDALHEMVDHDQIKRLMEQDAIEIVPLAYMRGRTLNEAFIILDEGQNTTVSQMKMFLTRMGAGSKIVVSGDITQVDLPRTATSGLSDAIMRLRDIERVGVVQMSKSDIVRHKLVQAIVRAYDDEPPLESHKRRRSTSEH